MRARQDGTIEWRGDRAYLRVSKSDGTRPRIPLGKVSPEVAAQKLRDLIDLGRRTGRLDELIDRAVLKSSGTRRAKQAAAGKLTTIREIAEAWTKGQLFKEHGPVNGLRALSHEHNTTGYNTHRVIRKRILPVKTREGGPAFGDLPALDVTHQDIAKIMAAQKGSAGTRNHVHNYLSRILSFAEIPLGLRAPATNPVLEAYRAPRDPGKLYNFLYPSEVLALLANTHIPLGRRVLYLLATYFGWRKGTLLAFDWTGVDWDHQTVSVFRQKGHTRLDRASREEQGTPIFFRIDIPGLFPVLQAWWRHCGQPARGPVIRNVRGVDGRQERRLIDDAAVASIRAEYKAGGISQRELEARYGISQGQVSRFVNRKRRVLPRLEKRPRHDEADLLRRDLHDSGVTRAILFSTAKNVQPIRFHDGRATFCTWARRAGKSDIWTTERTGHTPTSTMLKRYTRQAQTLLDLGYEPFPDVTSAIPELVPVKLRAVK